MRRLVYIHNIAMPGPEANTVQVAKMCSAFASLGHDVTLLAVPDILNEDYAARLQAHYGVKHTFHVAPLPALATRPTLAALAGALKARLDNADIVYTRTPHVALAACVAGLTTLFEAHTDLNAFSAFGRFCFEHMTRHPRLLGVIAISQPLAHYLAHTFPDIAPHIIVAHDGADPPAKEHVRPETPRFSAGYVGSLYEGKGIEVVLPLAELCPWADFHVVGGLPRQRQNAARREPAPNIHYAGRINHADVERTLAGFDAVLAPYQQRVIAADGRTDTARWMSPLKIFEYMASGRPIVASRMPAIEDILEDGATALLCDPSNPGEWAAALGRLRAEPALGARLGATARQRLIDSHTWERRAAYILDSFDVTPKRLAA